MLNDSTFAPTHCAADYCDANEVAGQVTAVSEADVLAWEADELF